MSMNVDILKALYLNNVSKSNTNALNSNTNALNSNTNTSTTQNSFLKTLNEALMGSSTTSSSENTSLSLLNSILGSSNNEDETSSDDMLTSLMLLMQQSGLAQNSYVDYTSLLNSLNNVDSTGIDSVSSVLQNFQSTGQSYEKLEALLLSLQNQSNGQSTNLTNTNTVNTQANAVASASNVDTDQLFAGRNFPQEIMDSINAVRQAHDNIRSRIEQTRGLSSEVISAINNNALATENTDNIVQNVQVTVASSDIVQDSLSSTNIVTNNTDIVTNNTDIVTNNTNNNINGNIQLSNEEASSLTTTVNKDQLESDFNLSEAVLVGTNEKTTVENKDSSNTVVNEGLLNVNGVDYQQDNKIIKVNDESSMIKDSVMTQIKDQIVLMKADGKQTVTMQLTPENLGKLDIKMVFENGNLSVDILASNPKTHSLILSNISELKSVLQNSFVDKSFMNFDNQKQMHEQNQNQNYQGSSQHQERNDRNDREYDQVYTDTSNDNDGIDFLTELTRLRDYRFSSISQF